MWNKSNSARVNPAACASRKAGVLFFSFLIFSCAIFISRPANALENVTLKLRYYHQFQFAGYYAALEKGYFREAGLDVRIVEGNGSNDQEEDVVAGRADYGISGSSLLVTRSKGQPVVVLGVVFQHSPFVLITAQGAVTQGIHDLPGKRVMIMDQSDEMIAYLNKEGIPLTSLKRLPHSFNPKDLVNGKVDAMTAFVTNEPEMLDRLGFRYQLLSPRSSGIDFYGDNLFTSEREIAEHPERVKAFRAAAMQGWQYAMNNPEEITSLILAKYSKRNTREHLLYEARQMQPLVQPLLVEIGYMNPGRWRHIADIYAELNLMPKNFSLDGFIYSPDKRSDLTWLLRALAAAGVLLVLGVAAHFLRLSRERKLANTALRASESHLRTLIEALPQQVWTARPDGRLDYINYRVTEYFGQEAARLFEGGLQQMMHPDDFAEAVSRWKEATRNGTRFAMDYRLRRADGEYRWHMGMALPLCDTNGRVTKWFGSSTDISDRKEAEEALQAMNENLETRVEERTLELRQAMAQIVESQKLASLGALVAGVSHELNTPIGNIVMIASALSDRVSGFAEAASARTLTRSELTSSLEECRQAAEIIVRSAHRAGDLIESFKRVSVDQASQRRRKFALRQTVQDILNAIGPTLRRANITLELDIPESIEMDSYPGHLEQIVSNLVMNSVKHGFEGLERGTIQLSASQSGGMIELVYRDDGRGIAHDLQHKVFEPFYTTKLGQGGSGLGMSIVHNLTHAIFKGRVRLESSPGRGVQLYFLWPAVTPEPAQQAALAEQ